MTDSPFFRQPAWMARPDGWTPKRPRRPRRATAAAHPDLTPRESEVCDLVCAGWANKEIAVALGLGVQTVKNYLFLAYRKLGVTTRLELMRYWLRHGAAHGAAYGAAGDPDAERRAA